MKNISKVSFLVGLIVLLLMFNVVMFILPVPYSGNFWVAYAFSTLALLLQVVFFTVSFDKATTLKKVFLGYPIFNIGIVYLVLQLIFGFLAILVFIIPVQFSIIVSVVLLGFALIGLMSTSAAREVISATEEKVAEKRFFIGNLVVDMDVLKDKTKDGKFKSILKDLADVIRYSDPMSSPGLAEIEKTIEAKVQALKALVANFHLDEAVLICTEIKQLFLERNKKCKLLK